MRVYVCVFHILELHLCSWKKYKPPTIFSSNEFDFLYEVGITNVLSRLEDRKQIVQSTATYFTVVKVKAQIDQIMDGWKCLGIDELIKSYPSKMHQLLVSRPEPLTSDTLFDQFQSNLSPLGSNRREDEEQMIVYWNHFLELIGCKFLSIYDIMGRTQP